MDRIRSHAVSANWIETWSTMAINDAHVRYWGSPAPDELRSRVSRDPVVVLPLAATEQHGPHLPLSTDVDIGLGLLNETFLRLDRNIPSWALPIETIGASLEHERYDGTTSMAPHELGQTIVDQGRHLSTLGIRRLVISNSHGGNSGIIESAALRLREDCELLVIKANYYRFERPVDVDLPDIEWRHGLHGGAVETAMMLHLRRECVKTDAINKFPSIAEELEARGSRILPTGSAAFAWLAGDLNPLGVVGDATLASAEIGRQLVSHYATILAHIIEDACHFPIDKLNRRQRSRKT